MLDLIYHTYNLPSIHISAYLVLLHFRVNFRYQDPSSKTLYYRYNSKNLAFVNSFSLFMENVYIMKYTNSEYVSESRSVSRPVELSIQQDKEQYHPKSSPCFSHQFSCQATKGRHVSAFSNQILTSSSQPQNTGRCTK